MFTNQEAKVEYTDTFNQKISEIMKDKNIEVAYQNPKYVADLKEISIRRFDDMVYEGVGLAEIFDSVTRTIRHEAIHYACHNDQQKFRTRFYELPNFKAVQWPPHGYWEVRCDVQLPSGVAKGVSLFIKKVNSKKPECHLFTVKDNPLPFLENRDNVNKLVGSVLENLCYYKKMLMATLYIHEVIDKQKLDV